MAAFTARVNYSTYLKISECHSEKERMQEGPITAPLNTNDSMGKGLFANATCLSEILKNRLFGDSMLLFNCKSNDTNSWFNVPFKNSH